jgi:hypothetical protein
MALLRAGASLSEVIVTSLLMEVEATTTTTTAIAALQAGTRQGDQRVLVVEAGLPAVVWAAKRALEAALAGCEALLKVLSAGQAHPLIHLLDLNMWSPEGKWRSISDRSLVASRLCLRRWNNPAF